MKQLNRREEFKLESDSCEGNAEEKKNVIVG